MSIAYPPRLVRYAFSSKKERDTARATAIKPGLWGNFPATIALYYHSPGPDFLSQRFYLTTHDGFEREDLYAVTFHTGVGSNQVTIYATTEHGSAPLAVAVNEKRYSSSATITLPGTDSGPPWTERLRYNGFTVDSYRFSFKDEVFEWREEERKRPRERQLVRLGSGEPEMTVANWTEGSVPTRDYRLAAFRFLDSAIREKLGSDWTLLAITTALAVCQRGPAIEGTMTWHEEKMLEARNYT